MYKIGFIDYFLDEWHAEHYPEWIKTASDGKFEVVYAYGDVEPELEGKRTNAEFCKDHGLELCETIDEVVEKSDCLILLAPDHPQEHLRLAQEIITTSKPIFIDKTFANTEDEGRQIFELAEAQKAPMYSTSALRYSSAYESWDEVEDGAQIISMGPGEPKQYSIHQIEPLIAKLQKRAERVMAYLDDPNETGQYGFLLDFPDDIHVVLIQRMDFPFSIAVSQAGTLQQMTVEDDYFQVQIEHMLDFFEKSLKAQKLGKQLETLPVCKEETLMVLGTRDLLLRSLESPRQWVD